MATVKCVKCVQEREAMAAPPFRAGNKLEGLGKEIQEKVCSNCYKDWIAMSVKLINEARLDTTDPRAQQMWMSQMRTFLNLENNTDDPWARFLNQRVKVETTGGVNTTATMIGAAADALNFAEFDGGAVPAGFAPSATGARGSATIARDAIRAITPA